MYDDGEHSAGYGSGHMQHGRHIGPVQVGQEQSDVDVSLPRKIYLAKDESCAICLSPLQAQALVCDADSEVAMCVEKLRREGTAVLSCGHCLHCECLTGFVASTPSYRLKCPHCRTPLFYSGAVVENMFA